jgi:CheY-like chemotaxis protein
LARAAANDTNSLYILVVEDEPILRENIATYLRDYGCTVHEADSAEQAVTMCTAGLRVDVLFTDINLNGIVEGWRLAKLFRTARPAVGIVYASGNSIDQSECVPGSVFFAKPYAWCDILAACRRLQNMQLSMAL